MSRTRATQALLVVSILGALNLTLSSPVAASPLPSLRLEVCFDPSDTTTPIDCPPSVPTEPTEPTDTPSDPPVDPPVEEAPPIVVEESPDNGTADQSTVVVPPPVAVVVPTPTPTPTRTAEPAPAGWDAPLYPDSFAERADALAQVALALSGGAALIIGIVFLLRSMVRRRPRTDRRASAAQFLPEGAARSGLVPATTSEFTDFDRGVLGLTPDHDRA